jgi:hypothetical protein
MRRQRRPAGDIPAATGNGVDGYGGQKAWQVKQPMNYVNARQPTVIATAAHPKAVVAIARKVKAAEPVCSRWKRPGIV